MRYENLLGETIATELSDLKWGEFRCTNCNKITEKDVIRMIKIKELQQIQSIFVAVNAARKIV